MLLAGHTARELIPDLDGDRSPFPARLQPWPSSDSARGPAVASWSVRSTAPRRVPPRPAPLHRRGSARRAPGPPPPATRSTRARPAARTPASCAVLALGCGSFSSAARSTRSESRPEDRVGRRLLAPENMLQRGYGPASVPSSSTSSDSVRTWARLRVRPWIVPAISSMMCFAAGSGFGTVDQQQSGLREDVKQSGACPGGRDGRVTRTGCAR